ncbi:MAG: fumarylacetoacetate hydrolase family protein [Methanobacteriaceae archaeon]
MKFLRFIDNGIIKKGFYDGEKVVELENSFDILNPNENGSIETIDSYFKKSYSLEELVLTSPSSPSKIVCIGLNYTDHAKELNMKITDEPKLFIKPSTSIIGHEDDIEYPEMSDRVDYEGELAVVIGKKCKDVPAEGAKEFIGGYTCLNDITARDLQEIDVQWTRAKSFDTFCPIGPFIERELDPKNQNIVLSVNGEIKQNSNTKNMIFNVFELIEFVSSIMTLNKGDIIATGTPYGVGELKVGDCVEVSIEDIGTLRNYVV